MWHEGALVVHSGLCQGYEDVFRDLELALNPEIVNIQENNFIVARTWKIIATH
jgi:hypothetical protein